MARRAEWGLALALAALGCTTPAGRPPLDRGGVLAAHPEPDLVTERYRVQAGDTLYGIARARGLTVRELAAANGLSEDRPLAIGQELLLPAGGEGPMSAREERSFAGGKPSSEPARAARPAPPRVAVGEGEGVLDWPLRGVLYARFGRKGKELHDGIDLAAPLGTPVKTAGPGSVLFAGEQKGYGQMVIVEHAGGLITLYAHNRSVRVKAGQRVREGQVIAEVGESGKTSGPHLHFEVRQAGNPVDPIAFLGPAPVR